MRWPWQKPEPKKPPECNHKYKDFPWYVKAEYWPGTRECEIEVIEPFVCVLCKHRKNVVLQNISRSNMSLKRTVELADICENKYAEHCKPRAIVEDMIADLQLIDREFLKYYEMVHNAEASTPKLKIPKDPNPVSPDQLMQWIMAKNGIEPYASHFKDVRGNEVHTIKPLTKAEIEQWNGA